MTYDVSGKEKRGLNHSNTPDKSPGQKYRFEA